jgi:hypothetical protein
MLISHGGKRLASAEKNKSSKVMRGPFVSASSSRLTLADLLSLLPLRGAARDLCSGSGLTANRINLPCASELYLAFNSSPLFSSTSALL